MKNVLYASCLCSQRAEDAIMKVNPAGIGLQVQKYHRLLARGLAQNSAAVHVLSYHAALNQLEEAPEQDYEAGVTYQYLFSARSGKLGNLDVVNQSYTASLEYLRSNPEAFVLCDVLNFSVSLGSVIAARQLKREAVGIITDFPEFLWGEKSFQTKMTRLLIRLCTGYVVLTEQMKEALSPDKKFAVLEGHVDSTIRPQPKPARAKNQPRTLVYAGSIHRKYGIERLVQAFEQAQLPNAQLVIMGEGDYAQELAAKKDNPAISYLGKVPNREAVEIERRASLLINPRPTDEEFTKYSFPSKNMEYMASGTALLTTRLPGMPKEYDDYVFLFDGETVGEMAQTLQTVMSLTDKQLDEAGLLAQKFVLEQKNNRQQAAKVLDMV